MMEDGIYTGMGYTPDPQRLSPNGAKKLLAPSTPKKFDYLRSHPQPPKRVFDFGNVAHKLVLGEGDQFLILHPEIHGLKKDGTPADNPAATTTWKETAANARAEGLIPIHVDDYHRAVQMAGEVHRHERANPLLASGVAEQWLYWTDTETGQGLRARVDWIHTDDRGRVTIVEYKTAVCAEPESFSRRQVYKFGYHIAAAFAIAGVKALGLDDSPRHVFIVQEKEPPFEVSTGELDCEGELLAEREMREAIRTYQQCMESNVWPSYPPGIHQYSPPLWALDDEEMEFSA